MKNFKSILNLKLEVKLNFALKFIKNKLKLILKKLKLKIILNLNQNKK